MGNKMDWTDWAVAWTVGLFTGVVVTTISAGHLIILWP